LKEFQEKLCDNGIPLTVHPGAELRLDPDLIRKIGSGEILTLNDTGRFALVELPDMFLPRSLEVFFGNMLSQGVTPVICHPERNHSLLRDPMPLFRWVEIGSLVQITAASVTGRFGSGIRKFSLILLEHGLAHVLGTDAHDPRMRTPVLSGAMEEVKGILGQEAVFRMVKETPRRIVAGESVIPPAPVPFVNGPVATSFPRKFFSFCFSSSKRQ
jgi:protein-tyrosine phosphatase